MFEWNYVDNNMFRAESERFEESEIKSRSKFSYPSRDSDFFQYDS